MAVRVLMIGNGSHDNRGCQAIDLGTIQVLAAAFGQVDAHVLTHTPGPVSFGSLPEGVCVTVGSPTGTYRRFSGRWASRQLARALGPRGRVALFQRWFRTVREAAAAADVVLALGGDNHTLDYGPPDVFWAMDRAALTGTRHVYLWGASIGPFSADPVYERFAAGELSRLAGVFARESVTGDYLADIGVRAPVHLTADPAFALRATTVTDDRLGFGLSPGSIGINVSPLLARYRAETPEVWTHAAAGAVKSVAQATGRPLVLVPHVVRPGNDDHALLVRLHEEIGRTVQVNVVPSDLDAAELKGTIARLACFVGARTHATIAALSSGVPTVSIAYSSKARGLNRELFGDERWVLDARDVDGTSLAEIVVRCLAEGDAIREALGARAERARADAYRAGVLLRDAIGWGDAS